MQKGRMGSQTTKESSSSSASVSSPLPVLDSRHPSLLSVSSSARASHLSRFGCALSNLIFEEMNAFHLPSDLCAIIADYLFENTHNGVLI